MSAASVTGERLVIAHLFPELLNLYGDRGNIRVLAQRGRWRGMDVEVRPIAAGSPATLDDVDVVFIGGGQDRQQIVVAEAMDRLAGALRDAVARGASLLAVCGGYQNLGHLYRSELVGELHGPGLFDASTEAASNSDRLVGGVVLELPEGSPITELGRESAAAAGHPELAGRLTGFENHSGRTRLGPAARPLGTITAGRAPTVDPDEGAIAFPGDDGLDGLRVGTYLHGPLLPRNPHLADYLVLSALRPRGIDALPLLDDRADWAAHAAFADHWRTVRRPGEAGSPVRRALERLENLLGPSR